MDKIRENRVYYFDFLRVACAFLIVYLHSTSMIMGYYEEAQAASWYFTVFTNSFTRMGVTIFFMISGALMLNSEKNDSIPYVLKNRVLKIFIQIIVWSIIYLFLHTYVWKTMDFNFVKYVRLIANSDIHSHLWFMQALLGLYIALPILRVIVSKVPKKYLWYLFILCFLQVYVRFGLEIVLKMDIRGQISIASGYLGAFLLGYLLFKTDVEKKYRVILYVLGMLSFFINVYMTLKLSANAGTSDRSWLNTYNMTILFQATAFFIMVKYSKFANNISKKPVLQGLSKLTFGIYIIHPIVIYSGKIIFNLKVADMTIPYLIIMYIIVTIITVLITFIISKIPKLNYLIT